MPVQIDDHLYVGSIMSTFDKQQLESLGITHVVNACSSDFLHEEVTLLLLLHCIGVYHSACPHS